MMTRFWTKFVDVSEVNKSRIAYLISATAKAHVSAVHCFLNFHSSTFGSKATLVFVKSITKNPSFQIICYSFDMSALGVL